MIAFSAPALSDTPIGAGVTGSGGTGPTPTDGAAARTQAGTESKGLRPDGGQPAAGSAAARGAANAGGTVSIDRARGATGNVGAETGVTGSGAASSPRQAAPDK